MVEAARANWHIMDFDDSDPFEDLSPAAGTEIDLTAPIEELRVTLHELVEREARFSYMELTCEYRDAGQDCRSCVHANARSKTHSALCQVGREQAIVVDELQGRWQRENGAVMEIAAMAAQCSEMGHLDQGLAAALSRAGL